MKNFYTFLLTLFLITAFSLESWGQTPNGFLNFGTTDNNTTATTGNTGFGGVRVGSQGGSFTIMNPGQSIGTDAELRGIAPTGGSINSVGITSSEYGTAAQTFTISFELHLSGGASGTWYFFAGNGASFGSAQTSGFTSAQVFTGIRWAFGASDAITTSNRSGANWAEISGTPFAQNTAYYVTVIGNNSSSTVNYGASDAFSVAANTYDLWINGLLVGNDLAKGAIAGTTDINAFRFYGESSTSNVATITLDNIRWYNTCVLPPTHLVFEDVPTEGNINFNLPTYTVEARSGSFSGPIANLFTGAITVSKSSGPGEISGTLSPNAVSGIGTFSDTQFDEVGTYTIVSSSVSPILNSQASEEIIISGEVEDPTLIISTDPALTETNLDNAELTLTLLNDEFVDATLVNENFTLNNAPSGVSVASVVHNSSTTATLTLDYDGTDFDDEVNNFNITIAAAELTSGEPLTSNNLTITATVEVVPTVTTDDEITTNGTTTATWGGVVTADGGEPVTQKGLVWNTSASPTTDNFKTEEDAGTGDITGNMTGLTPNTQYFLRAYAINSVGTSYGEERSFTTDGLGAPTANDATTISSTSFTANWSSVTGATSYRLDVATSTVFEEEVLLVEWNFPNNPDDAIADGGIAINSTKIISTVGANSAAFNTGGASTNSASASGWNDGNGSKYWLIDFNTEGYININISFKQRSSNTGPRDFKLQYRIGSEGAWTDITNGETTVANNYTSGAKTNLLLPEECEDQESVFLRWIMTSNTAVNASPTQSGGVSNLDDIVINGSISSIIENYNNLTVNTTSETITGLTAGTEYFYRVRAFSASSTSGNSDVISVTTANNSQNTNVAGTGAQNVPVAGTTGVGEVEFTNVITPGNLLISTFNNAPTSPTGITGNVSAYRWIIGPDDDLVIDEEDGYRLRFNVADLTGISELEHGNNNTIRLYKRTTPGSGAFSDLGFLTYDRNGTDGDQSDDILESALITTGFSEFAFGSESEPLPVELNTFTAKANGNKVNINWSTATEIMNYGFEIQRTEVGEQKTEDGGQNAEAVWEKVAFVEGHGNSNSIKEYSYTDKNVTNGKYNYRLKQIDTDGSFSYSQTVEVEVSLPLEFSLDQNYPNPFNPSTEIRYQITEDRKVSLKVYDILGNEVATLVNEFKEAGSYTVKFDGKELSSGIYFYSIKAGDFTSVKKMMLMK